MPGLRLAARGSTQEAQTLAQLIAMQRQQQGVECSQRFEFILAEPCRGAGAQHRANLATASNTEPFRATTGSDVDQYSHYGSGMEKLLELLWIGSLYRLPPELGGDGVDHSTIVGEQAKDN